MSAITTFAFLPWNIILEKFWTILLYVPTNTHKISIHFACQRLHVVDLKNDYRYSMNVQSYILFLQSPQNTSAPFPRNYKRPGWSIVVKWVLNHSRQTVKITHWLMNNPVIVLWHCCDIHFSNSTFNSKLSSLQVSFANSWKVWPSSWLKPSTIWSAGVCSSQACSAEAPSSGSAGTSSSTPFSTTGRSSATSWTQCVCFPTQTHLCQFQVREAIG